MSTSINLFDYELPKERIAQHSVEPRDTAKLLVLERGFGSIEHKTVRDLPSCLRAGDLLVFNNTKVFKARLTAELRGRMHELFLLRCLESETNASRWEALIKGARRFHVGDTFLIGTFLARLCARDEKSGSAEMVIEANMLDVLAYCDRHGHIPIPLYVDKEPETLDAYQTAYAKVTGSVAAPTAGFHFTPRLLRELETSGVEQVFVTLHVGIGTFQPVRTDTLEEHEMHREWVEISKETVEAIARAKAEGRRVIAVGTTTVRTLEGVCALRGTIEPYAGDINLFIKPGFQFHMIDGLLTNFHLPKSTLLVLVSAFAGREAVRSAYQEAIKNEYRFYSFGDAMLIL